VITDILAFNYKITNFWGKEKKREYIAKPLKTRDIHSDERA